MAKDKSPKAGSSKTPKTKSQPSRKDIAKAPRAVARATADRGDQLRARLQNSRAEELRDRLQQESSLGDVSAALAKIPSVTLPDLRELRVDAESAKAPVIVDEESVLRRAKAKRANLVEPRGRGMPVEATDSLTVTIVGFERGKASAVHSMAGVVWEDASDPDGALRAPLVGCPVGESRVLSIDGVPSAVRVDAARPASDAVDEPTLVESRRDELRARRMLRLLELQHRVLDAVVERVKVRVVPDAENALLVQWWQDRARGMRSMGIDEEEIAESRAAFVADAARRGEAHRTLARTKVVQSFIETHSVRATSADLEEVAQHLYQRLGLPLRQIVAALEQEPSLARRMTENVVQLKAIESLTRAVVGDALVDELRGRRVAM